jgi:hypothetical protein
MGASRSGASVSTARLTVVGCDVFDGHRVLAVASARARLAGMFEDATKLLKDALYVSVGLGVIAFQKAQVQRNELQKVVESRLKSVGLAR